MDEESFERQAEERNPAAHNGMYYHTGSVEQAITQCRAQQKFLIVFLKGGDHESYIADETLHVSLGWQPVNCIALRLHDDLANYRRSEFRRAKAFRDIFPKIRQLPFLMILAPNGKPLASLQGTEVARLAAETIKDAAEKFPLEDMPPGAGSPPTPPPTPTANRFPDDPLVTSPSSSLSSSTPEPSTGGALPMNFGSTFPLVNFPRSDMTGLASALLTASRQAATAAAINAQLNVAAPAAAAPSRQDPRAIAGNPRPSNPRPGAGDTHPQPEDSSRRPPVKATEKLAAAPVNNGGGDARQQGTMQGTRPLPGRRVVTAGVGSETMPASALEAFGSVAAWELPEAGAAYQRGGAQTEQPHDAAQPATGGTATAGHPNAEHGQLPEKGVAQPPTAAFTPDLPTAGFAPQEPVRGATPAVPVTAPQAPKYQHQGMPEGVSGQGKRWLGRPASPRSRSRAARSERGSPNAEEPVSPRSKAAWLSVQPALEAREAAPLEAASSSSAPGLTVAAGSPMQGIVERQNSAQRIPQMSSKVGAAKPSTVQGMPSQHSPSHAASTGRKAVPANVPQYSNVDPVLQGQTPGPGTADPKVASSNSTGSSAVRGIGSPVPDSALQGQGPAYPAPRAGSPTTAAGGSTRRSVVSQGTPWPNSNLQGNTPAKPGPGAVNPANTAVAEGGNLVSGGNSHSEARPPLAREDSPAQGPAPARFLPDSKEILVNKTPAAVAPATTAHLAFRLTDGTLLKREFGADDKLQTVLSYIDQSRTDGNVPYKLRTPFPHRFLDASQGRQTLQDLDLCPRSLLVLQPNHQGRQTAAISTGAVGGFNARLMSWFTAFAAILVGFFSGLFSSHLGPQSRLVPQLQHDPQPSTSVEGTTTEATSSSLDEDARPYKGGRVFPGNPRGGSVKQRKRGTDEDKDESNKYWNGNSTEFQGDE